MATATENLSELLGIPSAFNSDNPTKEISFSPAVNILREVLNQLADSIVPNKAHELVNQTSTRPLLVLSNTIAKLKGASNHFYQQKSKLDKCPTVSGMFNQAAIGHLTTTYMTMQDMVDLCGELVAALNQENIGNV